MADGIRGKDYEQYPIDIQKGILLHRAIDTFTDAHPVYRQSKHRLHQEYGHYSGVIMDIFYDHFLAKNWLEYSTIPLDKFVSDFYQVLEDNFDLLTPKTQRLLPYMKSQNWLLNYASIEGIGAILFQMDFRTQNKSKMQYSVNELGQFYKEFEKEFGVFFIELKAFVKQKMGIL